MTNTYLIDTDCLNNSRIYAAALLSVSEWRRRKIVVLKSGKDRRLSLGASVALDYALHLHGMRERDITYICNAHGKPAFATGGDIHFNLSHSGRIAACTISGCECGVDIQQVDTVRHSLIKRVCTEMEAAYLEAIEDRGQREETFFRIWTAKESYLKATGTGLSVDLRSIALSLSTPVAIQTRLEPSVFFCEYGAESSVPEDYKLTVCSYADDFSSSAVWVDTEWLQTYQNTIA